MAYSGDSALGAPAARPLSALRSPGDEQKAAESILRQTVRKAIGDEVEKVELLPVPGLAGRVLVETARALTATMVVPATRGEHAARLLGAVSQYVLRHAPCPVLVVPEASKGL
jgi:nucleotide-binding universal stress UspA family protein